jgi:ribonuclease Z
MSFSVTILGCSSALPTSKRFTTAQVVNSLERFFLVDCGEGAQIQMRKYRVKMSKINYVLISHLHADHFLGLFGLIASFNLLGRKNPLHIVGPHQLKEMYFGMDKFLNNELNFPLHFHNLNYKKQELIFEDDKIIVESFPVKHRIPTCGFLFKEKRREKNLKKSVIEDYHLSIKDILKIKSGEDYLDKSGEIISNNKLTMPEKPLRSYAFCSDTMFKEKNIGFVQKVNLLYHETTYAKNKQKQAKSTYHSTTIDAANTAKMAQVQKLIIGHFSSRYKDLNVLLDEAKTVFEKTSLATDGKQFDLSYDKENQVVVIEKQLEEK